MKGMFKKNDGIKKILKSEELKLAITLFNVAALIIAAYITYRLAPLAQSIAVNAQAIASNDEKDDRDHQTFVTKDSFNTLSDQVTHISGRVDDIYKILVNK